MATRDTVMRVRLTGDAAGAARAFRDLATEMARTDARYKDVAEAFIRESDRIEAKAKTTADKVQRSFAEQARSSAAGRLEGRLGALPGGGLLGDFGGAEAALGGLSTKATVAAAAVVGLGAAAAKAGQVSIQQFERVGSEVAKFQQTLGVSAEEASRFWYTLSATGVNPEQGLDALNQFAVNITQNKDDLAEFGVEVARFQDGSTDMVGTLYNVVAAYQSMGDSAERARLLSVTLGEEGMRQLQPLLRRNVEELQALGAQAENLLTDEQLQRLDDWRAAWGQLSTDARLAAANIGGELAPALTDMARLARDAAPGVRILAQVVGGLASASTLAARAVGELFDDDVTMAEKRAQVADLTVKAHERQWRAAQEEQRAVRSLSADKARAWQQEATQVRAGLSGQLASARMEQARAADAVARAEASAARSIAQADQQVAAAHDAAAKSIRNAERRVSDAYESQQKAVEGLQDAEREASKIRAAAAEDAARRVLDAEKRVADAREGQQRTQEDNLRRLEDADAAWQDAQRRALREDNWTEAQRIQEEALRDHKRTREDVAEAEQDAAAQVAEAEQGLKDAHVEAAERRAEAEERAAEVINAAQERVASTARAVADAQAALAEATVAAAQQVAAAEQARADAAWSAAQQIAAARQAEMEAAARAYNFEMQLQAARMQAYYAQIALYQAVHAAQQNVGTPTRPNFTDGGLSRVTSNMPSVARPQKRAAGGPVMAGQTYIVGDGGQPEILHMGASNGRVVPMSQAGGATVNVVVNGHVVGDRRALIEEIGRAVRDGLVGVG